MADANAHTAVERGNGGHAHKDVAGLKPDHNGPGEIGIAHAINRHKVCRGRQRRQSWREAIAAIRARPAATFAFVASR